MSDAPRTQRGQGTRMANEPESSRLALLLVLVAIVGPVIALPLIVGVLAESMYVASLVLLLEGAALYFFGNHWIRQMARAGHERRDARRELQAPTESRLDESVDDPPFVRHVWVTVSLMIAMFAAFVLGVIVLAAAFIFG